MAVAVLTAFADTTEQTVTSSRAYLKGVYVSNPAHTEVDGWISLWNAANPTPGTTSPDLVVPALFAALPGKSTYRVELPRVLFDTATTAFFSDTAAVNASAWNGSGATGYEVRVYYELA